MPGKVNLRQANIITCLKTLGKLGIEAGDNTAAIVISHDCDIATENEEHVEIIVGSIIKKPDGSLSYGKNPRRLHLSLENEGSTFIALDQAHKKSIDKQNLIDAENNPNAGLTKENKRVLQEWLAARYIRPAFPDSFENRLSNKNVKGKIKSILEKHSEYIEGLYFDMGEHENDELPPDEAYYLMIYAVYHAEYLPGAQDDAAKIGRELKKLFNTAYGNEVTAAIVLKECIAIADCDFSLAHLKKTKKWRLEHITNRELARKNG